MTWYKFWKKSGPTEQLLEEYVWMGKKDFPTQEDVKYRCEDWADNMPGGHNTHYHYGYEQVEYPPLSVLEGMLKDAEDRIWDAQVWFGFLRRALKQAKGE